MEIRLAHTDDLGSIVETYNHYVLNGFATFDETPLSVEDRSDWFQAFSTTWPYRLLVAEVVGFA